LTESLEEEEIQITEWRGTDQSLDEKEYNE
jgi:hypothetical protein